MIQDKLMTNREIMNVMQAITLQKDSGTWKKKIPVRILLAKNRSLPELTNAYMAFIQTATEAASQHDMKLEEWNNSKDPEIMEQRKELMNGQASVKVYTCPESVLDMCDGDKYDMLTDDDVKQIAWLIEEGKNGK